MLEQVQWLQERFPEGKYQDVVGLCKVADRTEYAEEQGYSLNAGRYVGVEIEDDETTSEEFKSKILLKSNSLQKLSNEAQVFEKLINENLKELFA